MRLLIFMAFLLIGCTDRFSVTENVDTRECPHVITYRCYYEYSVIAICDTKEECNRICLDLFFRAEEK